MIVSLGQFNPLVVTMMDLLRSLPLHVCSSTILSFLDSSDMGRLDSSLACSSDRDWLRRMLVLEAPIHLKTSSQCCVDAWTWFWKRGVSVWDVEVGSSGGRRSMEEITNVNAYIKLIRGGISLVMNSESKHKANYPALLSNSEAMAKIHTINAKYLEDDFVLGKLMNGVNHLRCFTCNNCKATDIALIADLVDRNVGLQEFVWYGNLDVTPLIAALARRGSTITDIDVSTLSIPGGIDDEQMCNLGNNCSILKSLAISSEGDDFPIVTTVGLTSLAVGCPKLEYVNLHGCPVDDPLPIFASYCPLLKSFLTYYPCSANAAVLGQLHHNCPHLTQLEKVWLAATAAEEHEHAVVFQRMEKLSIALPAIDGLVDLDVVHTLASCLGKVQYLDIDEDQATASILSALAQTCRCLTTFCIFGDDAEGTESALMDLVRNNPGLQELQLLTTPVLRDALLQVLGKGCSNLERLLCDPVAGGVSDAAVIAFATGCPKLTHLSMLAGETLTDAAVEALATHCSALRSLEIAAGTVVANAALTHLMVTRDSMRRLQVAVQQDVKDLQRRLWDAGVQVVCHHFGNEMVNVTRTVEKPENVDEEDEDFDY